MENNWGLNARQASLKRGFDLFFAISGMAACWWVILISALLARLDTGDTGFFVQSRVGRRGKRFKIIKIRTMSSQTGIDTCVTTSRDCRITPLGRILRRFKIDELPQLYNVLVGDMSFVGPRPDVPGFADGLTGEDQLVLSVRPGITGPATLYYRDEERLLARATDPESFNREVIFPHKTCLNKSYVKHWSMATDLGLIMKTLWKDSR